jgi:4-hydroxyphenylpyruvate dioxygenase
LKHYLYQGLETGSRNIVSHAVRLNNVVFVFQSALNPNNTHVGDLLTLHGDHTKDIAFSVQDLDYLVKKARENGAKVVRDIWEESDEHGTVRMATLQTVSLHFGLLAFLIQNSNSKKLEKLLFSNYYF